MYQVSLRLFSLKTLKYICSTILAHHWIILFILLICFCLIVSAYLYIYEDLHTISDNNKMGNVPLRQLNSCLRLTCNEILSLSDRVSQ